MLNIISLVILAQYIKIKEKIIELETPNSINNINDNKRVIWVRFAELQRLQCWLGKVSGHCRSWA